MNRVVGVVLSLCCLPAGLAQPAETTHARHVIIIGVDGLSIDGVVKAHAPRIHDLMTRAAWTMEARGVMPTLSSPNWASMIDGAGPEQHGITSNGYLHPMVSLQPMCQDSEGMFPTMFKVMRTQKPASRIAVFHDWPGFADLLEKDVPDVLQHEHGAARTTEAAVKYWAANRPDLMFVHLDNVDHTGHDSGWSSAAYYRAVDEADGYVGAILDMLQNLSATDSTFVLITSDHGGKGHNHGKNSLAEIQIPWILAGPDVAPGRIAASVYTFDTAATVAWLLGFSPSECWIGRPVLAAFRPADLVTRTNSAERGCAPERPVITVPATGSAGPGAEDLLHHGQHNN